MLGILEKMKNIKKYISLLLLSVAFFMTQSCEDKSYDRHYNNQNNNDDEVEYHNDDY